MKQTSLQLISVTLVLVLAVFSLTGCTFFKNIGNAFLDIFNEEPASPDEPEFNLEEAINEITTSKMCSTITLKLEHYNRGAFGMLTDIATVTGSGSIIMRTSDASGNKIYILTNAHCVESLPDRQFKNITMTDYCGNEYSDGKVLENSLSKKYDLAIVTFSWTDANLKPITLAKQNPEVGDTVIALGSPHSQKNAITVGCALRYYTGDLIEAEALYHSALVGSGGSGGALLNSNLELCGVNFAADDTDEDFSNGSSIPIETVREYLSSLEIFGNILN